MDNNYLNLNEDYNKLIKNIEEIKNLDNQEIDYQEEEKNINLKKKTLEDFRNKNLDKRLVLEDLTSQFNFYKNRLVQLDKELEDWSIRKKRSVDRQDNILSRKNEPVSYTHLTLPTILRV